MFSPITFHIFYVLQQFTRKIHKECKYRWNDSTLRLSDNSPPYMNAMPVINPITRFPVSTVLFSRAE